MVQHITHIYSPLIYWNKQASLDRCGRTKWHLNDCMWGRYAFYCLKHIPKAWFKNQLNSKYLMHLCALTVRLGDFFGFLPFFIYWGFLFWKCRVAIGQMTHQSNSHFVWEELSCSFVEMAWAVWQHPSEGVHSMPKATWLCLILLQSVIKIGSNTITIIVFAQ